MARIYMMGGKDGKFFAGWKDMKDGEIIGDYKEVDTFDEGLKILLDFGYKIGSGIVTYSSWDYTHKIKKLEEETRKLKSDLSECECSFGFESDEVGFWKREYKRLKKWIKDHCKGYGNLFPEDEMKRQWKKADKKRK